MADYTFPTPQPSTSSSTAVDALWQQGNQALLNRDYVQVITTLSQLLKMSPNHFLALKTLGYAFLLTGQVANGFRTYQRLLQFYPNNAIGLNGLAMYYTIVGEADEAIKYYKRAVKASPEDAQLLYNLGMMYQYGLTSHYVAQLHKLHQSNAITEQLRVFACFALARVYGNHGDHKREFRYYDEANRLQFALLSYKEESELAMFDAMEKVFDVACIARLADAGSSDRTPIFVLGMPRSGTSLVEQILASHSLLYGVGEAETLQYIAVKAIPQLLGLPFPQAVVNMGKEQCRGLAEIALQHLRRLCATGSPHIVDKTPYNVFLIGLLHLLFPEAPVIHCVRNPMDTCWSMFRQHFVGHNPYCYDQVALGRYYRRYRRLMDHWQQVLPGRVYDLRYEELVEQPETTMRALLAHCRLPWEDNCLSFYRTKRAVITASMQQVRLPIYKTSIGSWLPVAEELAPLRAALEGR